MSGWVFHRRQQATDKWQVQGAWCPFVDQVELVTRLSEDLAVIRGDSRTGLRRPVERAAVAALDAWICTVLQHLRGRVAGTTELDVIVAEWRGRRAPVGLKPERADIIAVAD